MNPFLELAPKKQVSQGNPFASLIGATPEKPTEAPQKTKGGFLGEVFTGNTQRFGKTVGQAFASGKSTERFVDALEQHSKIRDDVMKVLNKKKKEGKDTTILEKALANLENDTPKIADFTGEVINKSTGSILGEALGTAVEATGVGALKGMKGLGLIKVAKTTNTANKAKQAFNALSVGGKALKIGKDAAKMAATTAPLAYGYDVSAGLQGQRGEDKTGVNALRPGMGTALATAIPAGIGALRFGRVLVGKALPHIAANLSGEPLQAYQRRQTGQLEGKIKGAGKEKSLDVARSAVTKFRVGMIEEFGNSIDTVAQKYPQIRIGYDDINAKKLQKVADAFGFDMPQNVKSLSGKEASEVLTQLSESYIPNASTLADVQMNNTIKTLRDNLKTKAIKSFGGEAGDFAKAYKNYATKSDVYKDVASVVGKVGKRSTLQINAARNRLNNIFSENSTAYFDAVRKFEQATGAKILDQVAAARLNPLLPKTLRGAPTGVIGWASDIISLLAYPVSSPRMGSWVIKQLSGLDEPMISKLIDKVPGARKAIYNAVSKENMSFNDAVKKYAQNPKLGLSIQNVSPEAIAKRIDGYDLSLIRNYLKKDSIASYTKMAPIMKDMGIEKLEPKLQKRFLEEVMDLSTKKLPVKSMTKTPSFTKGDGGKFTGSVGVYKGEKDLTTKILKDLEGKSTVSKQYILDATNRPELKQVERDVTRQVLDTMPDGQINVKEFADKVKSELLPLKRGYTSGDTGTRYEHVSLPDELKGDVKNYSEQIYQSPIKTSAGDTHYSQARAEGYFGHTRIEDMADNKTRRVIEVQSDLYQKGNLEKETQRVAQQGNGKWGVFDKKNSDPIGSQFDTQAEAQAFANKPVAKLQQYNDPTAHFRMVREEIKKASQDGKTKLQFPTGETAMKIEGLGEQTGNNTFYTMSTNSALPEGYITKLKSEQLKAGLQINQGDRRGSDWIITDVLGDGKFKAIEKRHYDNLDQRAKDILADGRRPIGSAETYEESFDISGKVDTNNPIYKFYEKEVQRYLAKFGGKPVTDTQGVSWIEVPLKKEWAKMPVEAFALIGGIGLASQSKK